MVRRKSDLAARQCNSKCSRRQKPPVDSHSCNHTLAHPNTPLPAWLTSARGRQQPPKAYGGDKILYRFKEPHKGQFAPGSERVGSARPHDDLCFCFPKLFSPRSECKRYDTHAVTTPSPLRSRNTLAEVRALPPFLSLTVNYMPRRHTDHTIG